MTSYEVSMELWDDNHALNLFSVRGEAAARTVHVQLKEQGNAVDLTDKEVRVYMLTPNGSRIFSDCVLEDAKNGKLSFPITAKALEHRGLVECELWISGDSGMVLKVTGLKLEVRESIMDEDAIEGSDEFSALVEMLGSMKQWESEEEARKKAEAERMLSEQQRQQEETARQEAEGSRAGAEIARAAAEEERAAGFEALQAESQAGAAYAKEQGDYAKAQGGYAKEQGDYAKEQYDRLKDIDVSALQTDLEELTESAGQPNGIATLDGEGKLAQRTGLATLDGNGKLSLEEVPSANSMELWNLGEAEAIPSGADLDTYSTPGVYNCASKTICDSLLNKPDEVSNRFKLVVQQIGTTALISQTIYCINKIYFRYDDYYSGAHHYGEWGLFFIGSSDSNLQWGQRNDLGMNKLIYDGDWSAGSITVPEINNYSVLRFRFTGHATSVLCFNNAQYIRGAGGYTPSKNEVRNFYINLSVSGTTLTFVNAQMYDPVDGTLTDLSISRINGIA